jgi:hypothetical protein
MDQSSTKELANEKSRSPGGGLQYLLYAQPLPEEGERFPRLLHQ